MFGRIFTAVSAALAAATPQGQLQRELTETQRQQLKEVLKGQPAVYTNCPAVYTFPNLQTGGSAAMTCSFTGNSLLPFSIPIETQNFVAPYTASLNATKVPPSGTVGFTLDVAGTAPGFFQDKGDVVIDAFYPLTAEVTVINPTPTQTTSVSHTVTPTGTPTQQSRSNTLTTTATGTQSPTRTGTATASLTGGVSASQTATNTGTVTNTATNSPSASMSHSLSMTATATNTPTNTPATPSSTASNTATPSNTGTNTATNSGTDTNTVTATNTPSGTPSNSATSTNTATSSQSSTNTATRSPSATPIFRALRGEKTPAPSATTFFTSKTEIDKHFPELAFDFDNLPKPAFSE